MKLNSKDFFKYFFITLTGIVIAVSLFFIAELRPVSSEQNKTVSRFEVPTGSTSRSVAYNLKAMGLIRNSHVFYLCIRFPVLKTVFTGNVNKFQLKSGVYQIDSSMKISRIMDILSSGVQEYIRLSIPEGLTISKIGTKLEEAGVCSLEEFKASCKDPDLIWKYEIPSNSLEGFLFPDTYFFTPKMSGRAVVSLMVDNFFENIKSIPGMTELSKKDLFYNVTLASIVEREYRIDEEAPLIASVFKNRLSHNIGLYSCATVEYIITEIEGLPHPDKITYKDLENRNPYNTYKWAGLTPGPISNPGKIALNAAVNSAKTNYYYFRLVDAESGRHVFTKDFSTHISEGYSANTKRTGK